MNIYLDMDDVLCETARDLCGLVFRLFGKGCQYHEMELFDLQRAYGLTEAENRVLMENAHSEDFLGALKITPGADLAVRKLTEAGHEVTIVTGRPVTTAESSIRWLEKNNFPALSFRCLDKYNRWFMGESSSPYYLSRENFSKMRFDFFVDDSPSAVQMLSERDDGQILVFDRPWNQMVSILPPRMKRVTCWEQIMRMIK